MITKNNFSRATMQRIRKKLPGDLRQKIATELNTTYAIVNNVYSGYTYNEDIIRMIEKEYKAALKSKSKKKAVKATA